MIYIMRRAISAQVLLFLVICNLLHLHLHLQLQLQYQQSYFDGTNTNNDYSVNAFTITSTSNRFTTTTTISTTSTTVVNNIIGRSSKRRRNNIPELGSLSMINIFNNNPFTTFIKKATTLKSKSLTLLSPKLDIEQQKQLILQSIQLTNNGKTATIEQQKRTIQLVRQLEQTVSTEYYTNFFNPLSISTKELNGTWYLQYTSPSSISDIDIDIDNDWKPINPSEGISNIETSNDVTFRAQGTVSAAGITVDTSNRPTIQCIDVLNQFVSNTVQLSEQQLPFMASNDDNNKLLLRTNAIVGGTFRPSNTVPNRAIVSFTFAQIMLSIVNNDTNETILKLTLLDLSLAFTLISLVRNSKDNGWLETTYLDSNFRIGRGNKGTLFILTKDP